MIQRMTHAPIYVLDQDSAIDFYVNKLGFELKTDAKMGDFRWVTVTPKGQPDFEVVLMAIQSGPPTDDETATAIRKLVEGGKLGAGVFSTADCRATCAEMKGNGVEFIKEPTDEFYGVEAVFRDDSGNWFSLTQPK
jgi:predicted enzyme related to lactoylglutathione lyase